MRRTRHRLLVAVIATLAMVLAACGSDGDDGEAADQAADTATEDAGATDDGATDDGGDSGQDESADADETDGADTGDADEEASGTDDAGDDAQSDGEAAGDDMASATVAVAASDLGDILVDGEGRTLYMFLPDQADEPTCTGDCAAAWPVFEGPATAGDGVDASLLSTATHPSGATQVTYGGWPLYYFANDAAPGDVNGQGVNEAWFTLGPDAEPVRDDASASGTDREY